MPITLMRHAETDWRRVNELRLRGAANDLAPLTPSGREQARAAAGRVEVDVIVSSPMTRALETASIIAAELGIEVRVEFDLREWLPDETYSWTTSEEVLAAYDDMRRHDGVCPAEDLKHWEPLEAVRTRASEVLARLANSTDSVLAVTHEVVIFALTGIDNTGFCHTRPYGTG